MIKGLFARSKWRSGRLELVLSILYNLAELLMIQGGFPNLVVQDSLVICSGYEAAHIPPRVPIVVTLGR